MGLGNFLKKTLNTLGGGGQEGEDGGLAGAATNFLGGPIGGMATDYVGGLLTDKRERKNREDKFNFLQSKGLNAFEAAGAGGATAGTPGQSTLGNGPSRTMARQQQFTARENAKNRATELAKAKISAEAGLITAGVTKERGGREKELHTSMKAKALHEARLLNTQANQKEWEYINRWALKIAGMAEGNVLAAVAAYNMQAKGGPSFEEILTAKGFTKEKIKQSEDFINKIVGQGSLIKKNILGAEDLLNRAKKWYNENDNLINGPERQTLGTP